MNKSAVFECIYRFLIFSSNYFSDEWFELELLVFYLTFTQQMLAG
jgi:hypothetical protein